MSRRYFLIISNMRSGSTLLETMLGAIEGVFSDGELKWKPSVAGQPAHLPVSEETRDFMELFERHLGAGNARLVGSKLVIDPFSLDEAAQRHLATLIPSDWYVIHLTRSYRDIFLSRQRGTEHLRNNTGAPIKGRRLTESLTTDQVSSESSVATKYIARGICFRELDDYLANDLWISSLADQLDHYFQIDYRDIFGRFNELVRFMELDPADPDIGSIIARPPLQKLPSIAPERLVANIDELEPLFDAAENLRRLLILDHNVLRNFLPNWQAYQARAENRYSQGDVIGAIADYTKAIQGSPPNPALHYLRGTARLRDRDAAGATADFRAGLNLDPGNKLLTGLLKKAESGEHVHAVEEPSIQSRIPIHLVTQLWGESFVRLFLDVVLPSLATPGNLPALSGFEDVLYEIYTTRADRELIESDARFRAIRERIGSFVAFRFVEISPGTQDQYDVLADCHREAIRSAEKRSAAIIFLMPDTVLGDGAMRMCARRLVEGKRLVLAPGLRAVKEDISFAYAAYAKDTRPSVRKLVSIAVKNLHPISRALIWRQGGKINLYCSHLYWLCGDSSLYARCAGMHPLMVYPRAVGAGFSHTHDWDYWYRACPDENEWFVARSSEEICLIELSDRNKYAGTETWVPATPYSIANFMAITARASGHRRLLSQGYVFKGEGFDEHDWVQVHVEADELIAQSRHLLSAQEYQDRAALRTAQGDHLGAVIDYSAALKGSAPNPALYFLRGSSLLAIRDYAGAMADFDEGLRLSPGNGPLVQLRQHAEHMQIAAKRRARFEPLMERMKPLFRRVRSRMQLFARHMRRTNRKND